ncbi:MAG: alpha/beta hydrolase [Acidobacteriota bacterium]|nr:alpha/beta hydrolase [Acidobacteriota bacterium]
MKTGKSPLLLILCAGLAQGAVQRDIEYGRVRDEILLMDATIPKGDGPFPAAILVHGGAWVAGDKQAAFEPIEQTLTGAGFATFSINYRLAPKYLFPAAVHDVERAVAFVIKNAAMYKVDPDRVVLIGESAGAQLAEMAAVDKSTKAAAVVSFYAPSDLSSLVNSGTVPDAVRQITGDSPLTGIVLRSLRRFSPIEKVHKNMPPILFIHGTDDHIVPFESSGQMCDRMKEVGASCEVIPVTGGDHGLATWEFDPHMQTYKKSMIAWLKRTLG